MAETAVVDLGYRYSRAAVHHRNPLQSRQSPGWGCGESVWSALLRFNLDGRGWEMIRGAALQRVRSESVEMQAFSKFMHGKAIPMQLVRLESVEMQAFSKFMHGKAIPMQLDGPAALLRALTDVSDPARPVISSGSRLPLRVELLQTANGFIERQIELSSVSWGARSKVGNAGIPGSETLDMLIQMSPEGTASADLRLNRIAVEQRFEKQQIRRGHFSQLPVHKCFGAPQEPENWLVEARSRVENHVSVFCCDLSAPRGAWRKLPLWEAESADWSSQLGGTSDVAGPSLQKLPAVDATVAVAACGAARRFERVSMQGRSRVVRVALIEFHSRVGPRYACCMYARSPVLRCITGGHAGIPGSEALDMLIRMSPERSASADLRLNRIAVEQRFV
ncbi:hypothetical protein AK812_SmicGene43209 [Symbiodinium microadriaticum]|uniref:Uncharacterized protein n=1 Tax=Symbiodinium microadriaticum TaxID=2951 RepID=A0A1Q9C1L5_SYMMI|nr:hypothetical protein AK812_SmicGene43209 [Symbiodinium microadriaticum]